MRRGRLGFWLRLAVFVIKPTLTVFTKRRWLGRRNIPATGGVIVAVNHISYVDPFLVARFVYDAGRLPRFMAKAGLFQLPVAGRILRGAGQIPVHRYSENAPAALAAATSALQRGECVVIYPEGTVTRDPGYWPMRARTGVARLALDTGAPVVPVGQWGAQRILGRDAKPHLLSRRTVWFVAGPPVDLSAYAGREPVARALREMTELIMTQIRDLVGQLRDEQPPDDVYDPRPLTPVADDGHRRSA